MNVSTSIIPGTKRAIIQTIGIMNKNPNYIVIDGIKHILTDDTEDASDCRKRSLHDICDFLPICIDVFASSTSHFELEQTPNINN